MTYSVDLNEIAELFVGVAMDDEEEDTDDEEVEEEEQEELE